MLRIQYTLIVQMLKIPTLQEYIHTQRECIFTVYSGESLSGVARCQHTARPLATIQANSSETLTTSSNTKNRQERPLQARNAAYEMLGKVTRIFVSMVVAAVA